eukprot:2356139-Prymnesium_polylepis.1
MRASRSAGGKTAVPFVSGRRQVERVCPARWLDLVGAPLGGVGQPHGWNAGSVYGEALDGEALEHRRRDGARARDGGGRGAGSAAGRARGGHA